MTQEFKRAGWKFDKPFIVLTIFTTTLAFIFGFLSMRTLKEEKAKPIPYYNWTIFDAQPSALLDTSYTPFPSTNPDETQGETNTRIKDNIGFLNQQIKSVTENTRQSINTLSDYTHRRIDTIYDFTKWLIALMVGAWTALLGLTFKLFSSIKEMEGSNQAQHQVLKKRKKKKNS